MIAPHMATLLVVRADRRGVSRPALRRVLADALPQSFNAIVVDGDMSTNDTVLLLANGVAGNRPLTPRPRGLRRLRGRRDAELMRGWRAWSSRTARARRKVIDIVVRGGAHGARCGARGRRDRALAALQDGLLRRRSLRRPHRLRRRLQRRACSIRRKLDVYLDDVQIVRRGVEVVGDVERRASRVAARTGVHAHARPARRTRRRADAHGERSDGRLRALQLRLPHVAALARVALQALQPSPSTGLPSSHSLAAFAHARCRRPPAGHSMPPWA